MKNRYRDMTLDELRDEESQLRTVLFNLRVGNTTKELANTAKIPYTRKELARLLTVLRENELAEAEEARKAEAEAQPSGVER